MRLNLVSKPEEKANPATRKKLPFSAVELGERIVQLRKRKGWSRRELARRLGVSPYRLAKWEQGANLPPFGMVAPMAQTLEVTLDELLTGEPPGSGLPRGQQAQARSYIAALARLLGLSREPNRVAAPNQKRP